MSSKAARPAPRARHLSFSPCPTLSQAVPATLKRYGLSQIINHLLALGECIARVASAAMGRRK